MKTNSEKYVITICREFGSMGRSIARELSELLDIEYYDRDIVEKVAKETEMRVPVIAEAEEKAKKYWASCFPLGSGTTELQDKIFSRQYDIIRNLADKESCIIVGRCADYILKDYKNCLNIYIYAPYDERLKNSVENLGIEKKEAEKIIKKADASRIAYHLRYAKYRPDDVNYKDILINSSVLGIDGTAKLIANVVREKFHL